MGSSQSREPIGINGIKTFLHKDCIDTNINTHTNISKGLNSGKLCVNAQPSASGFSKTYFIPFDTNNHIEFHIISLLEVDDKIFLYVHNCNSGIRNLIHIFEYNDIKMLEKYVQMSYDFKTLSVPDGNLLYVFKVENLIKHQSLKVSELNIQLKLINDIPVMETTDTQNQKLIKNIPQIWNFFDASITGTTNTNNTNNATIQSESVLHEPYKCILYSGKYVVISKNSNSPSEQLKTYKSVIIYDFIQKQAHMLNINQPIQNLGITFSENGKYLLFSNKDYINLLYLNGVQIENKKILQNEELLLNTIAVSNDGKIIIGMTTIGNVKLISNNGPVKMESFSTRLIGSTHIDLNAKDIIVSIFDYNNFSMNNNIPTYVASIWNKKTHSLFMLTIVNFDQKYVLYGPEQLKFEITGSVQSVHANGRQYIYKFPDYLIMYDINKVIPFVIINALLDTLKLNLKNSNTNKFVQIIVANEKFQEKILVEQWIVNLFSITNNQINLKICSDFDVGNIVKIFFAIMHDHYCTEEYIQCILDEKLSKSKLDLMFSLFFQLVGTLKSDSLLANFYMEYLMIKFILIYVKNKYINNKIDIDLRHIILTFNNLKVTREFLLKSVSLMFGINLSDHVAHK